MELLQYLFIAVPYLVMAGLAIGLCLFFVTAFRSPTAGLVLVGLLCLFDTLVPNAAPLQLGLLIYVPDIVSVMLGVVALLRALFVRNRPPIPNAWYLFVAVVTVSFAFGIATYGTAAGGALRPYFYAIAIASYFMTFAMDEARVKSALNAYGWVGLGVMLVVLARWVIVALPIDALLPPAGFYDPMRASILRVIGSDGAMVIAGAFVVGLFYAKSAGLSRSLRLMVPIFALVVIGLQHRSVWVAVLAAVGARFALPAAGRRGATQLMVLALVLAVIAVPVLLSGGLGGVGRDISQSAGRAVAMTDSAQVRLNGWKFAFDKWRTGGPKALAIGLPIGTSMDRYQVTSTQAIQRISFQVHNYYVQTLFITGLLGLGANLLLYAWVMRRLYRLAPTPDQGPMASALLLLLVLQLAFYITYGVDYMQGMVLGLAVAYAITARAVQQSTPEPRHAGALQPQRLRPAFNRGFS